MKFEITIYVSGTQWHKEYPTFQTKNCEFAEKELITACISFIANIEKQSFVGSNYHSSYQQKDWRKRYE